MSSDENQPELERWEIDGDVAAVLAAESARKPPHDAKATVRTTLARAIASAPPNAARMEPSKTSRPGTRSLTLSGARLVAALGGAFLAGSFVTVALLRANTTATPAPMPSAAPLLDDMQNTPKPAEPAPPPSDLGSSLTPAVPIDRIPMARSASRRVVPDAGASAASVTTRAPTPDAKLAAERTLVERARAAISRRDGPGALTALDEHARGFASGELAEERDALFVEALVVGGQFEQARAKAADFRVRYPGSFHAPAIDRSIRSIP